MQWEVIDAPEDRVGSGNPSAPAAGAETVLRVPSPPHPTARWPRDHPGALEKKALAFRIRAFVVNGSDTVWSEPRTIRQHETDVVRQEYIDYQKKTVPDRGAWGTPESPNFSRRELNTGDYSVYLAEPELLQGMERVREAARLYLSDVGYAFRGLTVTSAFRNPVHHLEHAGGTSVESTHQYGLAADIRIWDLGPPREEVFKEFYLIAKHSAVSACYEPEDVVRRANRARELTHAHFDWRSSPCPPRW